MIQAIEEENTSLAWLKALQHILDHGGNCSNLIVQIKNPLAIDPIIQSSYEEILKNHGLLSLKQVIYTVFPQSLYEKLHHDPTKLFDWYNRDNGVFERLTRQYRYKMSWGSYFRRMTHYPNVNSYGNKVIINQIDELISMLNNRERVLKAAYTINIQIPSQDCHRIRGGPCLNYIAIQLNTEKTLNFLAVYRNHDFIQRSYGNYISLGLLMQFICENSRYKIGSLTCISSHASTNNLGGHPSWPTNMEIRSLVNNFLK